MEYSEKHEREREKEKIIWISRSLVHLLIKNWINLFDLLILLVKVIIPPYTETISLRDCVCVYVHHKGTHENIASLGIPRGERRVQYDNVQQVDDVVHASIHIAKSNSCL